MTYLFDNRKAIQEHAQGKQIFIFLDYDGTLASISEMPDKAFLTDEIYQMLLKLTGNDRFHIAIISGRSLEDITKRVGIPGITYAGNHGLEIHSPLFEYRSVISAEYKRNLRKIKEELIEVMSAFEGVMIEDKKLTLTLHYRLAKSFSLPALFAVFHQTLRNFMRDKKVKVRQGKKIFEILPPISWNKGLAVSWILKRPEFSGEDLLPFYFGDDITDEDAFEVLNPSGITVLVGKRKNSKARYYISGINELKNFIQDLLEGPAFQK